MKPMQSGFVENALKHGVAGINIDGTRIQGPKGDGVWGTSNKTINKDRKFNASPEMGEYRSEAHSAGRWPANIVLGHLEGCRLEGVKKVKAAKNNGSPAGASRNGTMGDFSGTARAFDYADADGKETVEAWECREGCPVAVLDQQSGVCGDHGTTHRGVKTTPLSGEGMFGGGANTDINRHSDKGGASRFFKRVKT
jgi:hypothetical protein